LIGAKRRCRRPQNVMGVSPMAVPAGRPALTLLAANLRLRISARVGYGLGDLCSIAAGFGTPKPDEMDSPHPWKLNGAVPAGCEKNGCCSRSRRNFQRPSPRSQQRVEKLKEANPGGVRRISPRSRPPQIPSCRGSHQTDCAGVQNPGATFNNAHKTASPQMKIPALSSRARRSRLQQAPRPFLKDRCPATRPISKSCPIPAMA